VLEDDNPSGWGGVQDAASEPAAGEARPAVGRVDNLLREVGREPIAGHRLERRGVELQKLSQHHPHGRAGDPRRQRQVRGQGTVVGAVPKAQGGWVEHEPVQDQV
jgi:hypothetical protein